MLREFDYIIIGSGIVGLSIARALKEADPSRKILLVEKEAREALHASGRNSGVLHSGFYYAPGSLKARLTVGGNRMMREYCLRREIPVNHCGKLVVAGGARDLEMLFELEKRGKANGCNIRLLDAEEVREIDPNARTYQKALYAPDTATVNPGLICERLREDITEAGVYISFYTKYLRRINADRVETTQGDFVGKTIINCSGLYADQIAHDYGLGQNYVILPFKGLYLKYTKNMTDVITNIYPVPDLKNPFLGVHFTKTVSGEIKIGPTAIPAFWRENYEGSDNFNMEEFKEILSLEARLFLKNSFGFRSLAFREIIKYNKSRFVRLASRLVYDIDHQGFTEWTNPGIRAQLVDRTTERLVQDFVVEQDKHSLHILNAVSPAFTCAFSFAEFIKDRYLS
jgi:L-2-hydroxyglutarate oxidase LhgO